MLRCAIFAPDPDSRDVLQLALEEHPDLLVMRCFDEFLSAEALIDFVRAHSPQVLFFDIALGRASMHEAAQALKGSDHVHIVAVDRELEAEVLLELMNAGVREFLRFPFDQEKLAATLARIENAVALAPAERESTDLLYSFLPAKPGTGASIAALHTAIELSLRPQHRVLFTDFDTNSGVSRFAMKLTNPLGLRDAIARIHEMDESLWSEFVSRCDDLDLLPATTIETQMEMDAARIRKLFEFARRRYKVILADLSGMLEQFSLDVMLQSRRVLLVVEPELVCAHQAREKLRFLEEHDLKDRVGMVITKWRKDAPLTIADLESVLGLPAEATISDCGEQIHKSLLRGCALEPTTNFYREIADLAAWLSSETASKRANKTKRKIEYFSILPGRYSLSS